MIDDFVRSEIRPLLKEAGFGANGRAYRRRGDGVWQFIYFDHPYGPDTVRVNAYVAVPALIDYDATRFGFGRTKPSRANSHLSTTLGGAPASTWPMIWKLDSDRDTTVGQHMREALNSEVLPWLNALRSEKAVRDVWLSLPWREWAPASIEHLSVLLERNGPPAQLAEAKAGLTKSGDSK